MEQSQVMNVHEAKTHLSKLLNRVEAGEEIVIARAGKPCARLVPYVPAATRRMPGRFRGLKVPPEFFDPLPDDELALWEGE